MAHTLKINTLIKIALLSILPFAASAVPMENSPLYTNPSTCT